MVFQVNSNNHRLYIDLQSTNARAASTDVKGSGNGIRAYAILRSILNLYIVATLSFYFKPANASHQVFFTALQLYNAVVRRCYIEKKKRERA